MDVHANARPEREDQQDRALRHVQAQLILHLDRLRIGAADGALLVEADPERFIQALRGVDTYSLDELVSMRDRLKAIQP